MVKKVFGLFLALALLISPAVVLGQEMAEESPAPEEVEEVNSFELFWPMVAGKTVEDPLFPLKRIKEKVRGLLIFGSPQKVDYSVFLGTKRLIEAEKLMGETKTDKANKSLDLAINEFSSAQKKADSIESGEGSKGAIDNINNSLDNLEIFLPFLSEKYPDYQGKLKSIQEMVVSLSSKI